MSERTWTAQSGYRYGFGGHEKVDEINSVGNYFDLGARMYDPRIGRTQVRDPEAIAYPMFSPYMGFGNNPLSITDPDGKLLRDNNGNLIVVEAGKTIVKTMTVAYEDAAKTKPIVSKVTYMEVYIFANDGTKIKALMKVSEPSYYVTRNGAEVKVDDPASLDGLNSVCDFSSNCHGVSIANGQLWIDAQDGLDAALANEKEFETTTEENADIAVYSTGTGGGKAKHTAPKKKGGYEMKDGFTKKQMKKNATEAGGGKYSGIKYKNEKETKSNWAGGDTQSRKGLRIFKSKAEVIKSNPTDSKKLKI